MKICVVEDDPAYLFLLKEVIKSVDINLDVISFVNGKPAIDFLSLHVVEADFLPDVIFLDLNMPVMDGWMFLDVFEKLQPGLKKPIPVYVLSSSIAEKDIARANQNKLVVSFLGKPLEDTTLAEIIKRHGFKTKL